MSDADLELRSDVTPPEAPAPSTPVTNPRLSAAIASDFSALKNDVEQAKELASDYQRQLAGKSNELADFKHLFEKTQRDLINLQASIGNLRLERHRLANEAMRAEALELRLKKAATDMEAMELRLKEAATEREPLELRLKQAATERECLVHEVEALRRVRAMECDPRVKKLTAENDALRAELAEARRQMEGLKNDAAQSSIEIEPTAPRFGSWQRR